MAGIVAEAGTGKSRLCFEFAESCRPRAIPVYETHAVAHGKAPPRELGLRGKGGAQDPI